MKDQGNFTFARVLVVLVLSLAAILLVSQRSNAKTYDLLVEAAATGGVKENRGRIDAAIPRGDLLRIVGWVHSGSSRFVTLSLGDREEKVFANQARLDVEVVSTGQKAWGFEAVLPITEEHSVVCLVVDEMESDCEWFACTPDVFTERFRQRLEADFVGRRFTAHVIDDRTGCEYSLNENLEITVASVVKLEILGGLFLEAQQQGRRLSPGERRNAEAMMHFSLNPESSLLWSQVGGVGGLTELDNIFGAKNTTHVQPFGATVSTARDRSTVAAAVLSGAGPLKLKELEEIWELMRGVHPAQQWGVSAKVPEGFEVVLKNGFFPMTGAGWRIGSTGYISDPDGGGYAMTVLTDRFLIQAEGVKLVEQIAARVNRRLTSGPVRGRPWEEVECITNTSIGGSWASFTRALGLSSAQTESVRRVAGGDGPYRGQSICVP